MKTYLDCIPCFFRQALEGGRIAGALPRRQKLIVDMFAAQIPHLSLQASPPEIARICHAIVKQVTGRADPYGKIKRKSNLTALKVSGKLRDKVKRAPRPLLTAVELAIAGNVIDFGVKNNVNVREELRRILAQEHKSVHKRSIFHYAAFRDALKKSKNILYLADNAGETLFDRILIEEIQRKYPGAAVAYAVKEKPIINDALREDARVCGVDRCARVISNGSDAPGTVLALCSAEFRRSFARADMIISKGQGNYESLSGETGPLFFLFMVKCPVVAKHTGCRIGETVLLCSRRNKKALRVGSAKRVHGRKSSGTQ
jgi:hypothetical protein